MEDAMENRTKPSPSPRPLPRGEGEHANASSRLGECRLRSHAPKLGATAARPSPARPNALAHSALPDEPSGSPSPLGRGRGEGEGISLSLTVFFSAVGSGLNSTENSEEPTGISLVDDAKASSSFVEQPASAEGGVLLGEMLGQFAQNRITRTAMIRSDRGWRPCTPGTFRRRSRRSNRSPGRK